MDRRRLVYYLLLNVFVSACVTLAILYWYDRNYRAVSLPQVAVIATAPNVTGAASTQTIQQGTVKIISVAGAGTLDVETVVIRYTGAGELNLTGWHIKNANGDTYTFPPFKLFPNGEVQVHSTSGSDTAIDLYWDLRQPAWQSGETALLTDSQDNVQATYPVP